jgi:potassium/hydrogen antiporter
MTPIEWILLATALFFLISIFVSKLSVRVGVPALLLFLALGMLAGSDGPGGIYFDDPWLAQSVGVVALAFILFSGGLDTPWSDVRPILRQGLLMSTIGVTVTALSVGWFVQAFFGFTWLEGILLGAIISSTDAAAVFSVLRGKRVQLKGNIKPLLELESGSNDPMAVFLTLAMIVLIGQPELSPLALVPMFLVQMGIGALVGVLGGASLVWLLNRVRLEYDGLYPVMTIAAVLLIYGGAATLGGNGFLAVYLAGILMARQDFIHKRSLLQFHDGIAWLMQIAMFLTLGLQVFPSQLPGIAAIGLVIGAFLSLIARPLSVWIALVGSGMSWRDKAFISWVGLRGAAPIVLATFPLLAGVDSAPQIFNLVFFIVLVSVLLQGSLIIPIARLLNVYDQDAPAPRTALAFVMDDGKIGDNLMEIAITDGCAIVGQQIIDVRLPPGVLVALIARKNDTIVPNGSTRIETGDRLLLVLEAAMRDEVRALLLRREGNTQ